VKGLKAKGIVTNERVFSDETRIAELEERLSSLSVSSSRLNAAVVGADRDLANLSLDRKAFIETEMQRVDRDIAQLEIEVDSATQSFRSLTGVNPVGRETSQPPVDVVSYEIVRKEGTVSRRFAADRSTELTPGDLVIVAPRREAL
jgi:hypothetical protein